MAKVSVTYAHHSGEHKPGDKVDVEEEDARQLVNGGVANYSTVPDAKAVGADPSQAQTKKN